MSSLPTVLVKPGEADRILAGHPWIYHGSILRLTGPAENGQLVQVKDHRQRFLGTGFYNGQSKINVRMASRERVEVDRSYFRDRVSAALRVRQRHMPGARSFRVVNSESDFLSGLIVDKYEDVLVAQFASLAMDVRKALVVEVLREMFSPRAILERSDMASRKFEGLEESHGLLAGALEGPVEVEMNGLRFHTNLKEGHKTGMYLDQQENYARAAELAARGGAKRALDCFTFQGGFSLHLARAGVEQVHGLDQSEEAVGSARHHARVNGLEAACTFEAANVFDWLKAHTAAGPHEKLIPAFDVVVLDPPSFTRTRRAVPDALRGYKEINLRAMRLLVPGGCLVTCTCSYHMHPDLFAEMLHAASIDSHAPMVLVEMRGQARDHPVLVGVPETSYLTCAILRRVE